MLRILLVTYIITYSILGNACTGEMLKELRIAQDSLSKIDVQFSNRVVSYDKNKLIKKDSPNEKTLPHLRKTGFNTVFELLEFKSNLYQHILNIVRINQLIMNSDDFQASCVSIYSGITKDLEKRIKDSHDIYYEQKKGLNTYHPYFNKKEINAILSLF